MYGLLELSGWGYLLAGLGLTHITIISVTIYLHRYQAHRAVELNPLLSHFFRMWLWLTTGMETKAWTAIHRKHHAKCETVEDPHSPQILGLSKVLWHGAELYRKEAKNVETLTRYGHGTPDDWLEKHLYTPHSRKGIFIMLFIDLILFGVPGITLWAIQMIWIPFWAAGVVNGIGHYFGYRNFECEDASTNLSPIGILIGGEEFHNNHHAYPSSAKLSVKWWEFDIGWLYIKVLSALGLLQIKRTVPKLIASSERPYIDQSMIKAIIENRLQILSDYSAQVLLPVFKEERKKTNNSQKNTWKEMKPLIIKSHLPLDNTAKVWLNSVLKEHPALNVVYAFKARLLGLWQEALPYLELAKEVSKWCQDAETSEIGALRNFSKHLRSLSVT